MNKLVTIISILPLLALPALSQEGDKKDTAGTIQADPIPMEQIPPSPLLSQAEALEKFEITRGFTIEPVVPEELVHMPVVLTFDSAGRVWIVEMRSYMPDLDGNGEDTPNGRIQILEDTTDDGYLDKVTTFLDGLVLPRAIALTEDGCLYTDGLALHYIKRDGIKPIGKPELVDDLYVKEGNPEHQANALTYGHDNWLYSAKSKKRFRKINGEWVSEATPLRGQWGLAKDNLGRLLYNTNSTSFIADQFSPQFFHSPSNFWMKVKQSNELTKSKVYPIRITPGVNRAYNSGILDESGKLKKATAISGIAIYRDNLFSEQFQNSVFAGETAADLMQNIKVERDKYHMPTGKRTTGTNEFLATTDEWFLPCSSYLAPDGSIWVLDMNFGLTQHKSYMTSYLRRQYSSRNLDKPAPNNGRIYRIKATDSKLRKLPVLEQLTSQELLPYLSHDNGTTRDMAQRILVEKADSSIAAELRNLVSSNAKNYGWLHAAWTLHGIDQLDTKSISHLLEQSTPDMVNAGLEFSLEEKHNSLSNTVSQLKASKQTAHALAKALAHYGFIPQALELVEKHNKAPRIREAFLAGLSPKDLYDMAKDPATDKEIANLLAYKNKSQNQTKVKPLKGAHKKSFDRGKAVYTAAACFGCHGTEGEGMDFNGPPLVNSEWVTKDENLLSKILLKGLQGPLKVNGKEYKPNAPMPAMGHFSDEQLADVMTFIRYSWGNSAKQVLPETVKKAREQTAGQKDAFKASDIQP